MDQKTKKIIWGVLILFGLYRIVTGMVDIAGPNDQSLNPADSYEQQVTTKVKQEKDPVQNQANSEREGDSGEDVDAEHFESAKEDQQESYLDQLESSESDQGAKLVEEGQYYALEDVADYLHLYGHLPGNYIRKSEAERRGWSPEDTDYVVGGDRFGNREGKLPKKAGRQYYEADIQAGYTHHRGPQRLVYSDDGLIFYTADHYETFEQLY